MHIVSERFVVNGEWRLSGPFHSGGELRADSTSDMQLARDSRGKYYIAGASIAGSARNYLARKLQTSSDYCTRETNRWHEPDSVHALLGDDFQSLLSVFDAKEAATQKSAKSVIRDGIEVETATTIAADKRKFITEVLPEGTTFTFCFWLRLFEENPFHVQRSELLRLFRTMLDGFSADQGIRLGARTRKGWGKGTSRWEVLHYKMPEHLDAWLDDDRDAPGLKISLNDLGEPITEDHRKYFVIDARMSAKTSVLVRRQSELLDTPDLVHVSENGKYPLPGTSVGGALRARIEQIARTKLGSPDKLLNGMLGPRYKTEEKTKLTAGRLWLEETLLQEGSIRVQGRNMIDRFSGGTIDTALLHEAAWWPNQADGENWRFKVALELPDSSEQALTESALLLHAFRDLWLADLPIGGEAGGGRGVFRGRSAILQYPGKPSIWMSTKDQTPSNCVEITFKTSDGDEVEPDWIAWKEIEAALATPNTIDIDVLNEGWLQSKVSDVSGTGSAIAFVQGYPATGFARLTKDSVEWKLAPEEGVFEPRYSSDVRLFGDHGEWHCWSVGQNQWKGRLARVSDPLWKNRAADRKFVLWGTEVKSKAPRWTCLGEARGVRLWVPLEDAKPPVFVPVWERLSPEPDTGLAYVKDAMLRPFVQESE